MCKLFIGADSDLWQPNTRSIRIDGFVTSIRLESFFWGVLQDIAQRDGLSLGRLVSRLYNESIEEGHDLDNFTSFLRVCCSRYLSLQLAGEIPKDINTPIGSLDADGILARERKRNKSTPDQSVTPVSLTATN